MVWVTPKTDFAGGALASSDMNNIGEDLNVLKTHVDDTTIHQTTVESRTAVTALVIETRTSDPTSRVNGQIWLRTDL